MLIQLGMLIFDLWVAADGDNLQLGDWWVGPIFYATIYQLLDEVKEGWFFYFFII